jgi:hypothetical protein
MAISDEFDFSFSHDSSDGGSSNSISVSPNLIYFVADDFGIGGQLVLSHDSDSNDSSTTAFGVGPVVGYNILLGPRLSLFPTASVAYINVTQKQGTIERELTTITSRASVSLLFHPFAHVSVGVSPGVSYDLSAELGGNDYPKTTTFDLELIFAFWL